MSSTCEQTSTSTKGQNIKSSLGALKRSAASAIQKSSKFYQPQGDPQLLVRRQSVRQKGTERQTLRSDQEDLAYGPSPGSRAASNSHHGVQKRKPEPQLQVIDLHVDRARYSEKGLVTNEVEFQQSPVLRDQLDSGLGVTAQSIFSSSGQGDDNSLYRSLCQVQPTGTVGTKSVPSSASVMPPQATSTKRGPPLPPKTQSQKPPKVHSPYGGEQQRPQRDPNVMIHERDVVIAQLQSAMDQLSNDRSRLQISNDELKLEQKRLNNEVAALQESSFKSLEDARWMPMSTDTIRAEFDRIRESIKRLARIYAPDIFRNLDEQSVAHLMYAMKDCISSRSDLPSAFEEVKRIDKGPRLCLEAFISRQVHTRILESPFFFVDDGVDRDFDTLTAKHKELEFLHERRNATETLHQIWQDGCGYDVVKANLWRSDTLRLLNPLYLSRNDPAAKQQDDVRSALKETCSLYASQCAENIPKALLHRMETSMYSQLQRDLREVFLEAGGLSIRLWVQRPSLKCCWLSKLAPERFDISSKMMQAHPFHKIDDPEDRRFDGLSAKIVVHPAVLAAGTRDGEHYDQSEIWAPAMVWLDLERPSKDHRVVQR